MKHWYKFLLLSFTASLPAMADIDAELFLPNTVIQNGCIAANTGVFSGNFIMVPVYEDVDTYHCNAGQYLPKDAQECITCPENSYCAGGDFDFSDSEAQGIASCPEGTIAPEGTFAEAYCGKIMHVGEDIMYLTPVKPATLPALAVKIEGTVYYAHMTPISQGVKTINKDSTKSLRTKVDGIEYSIHDYTKQGEQ